MKRMMEHMRMGMMTGMEDSIAKCPMMKSMGPAKDARIPSTAPTDPARES